MIVEFFFTVTIVTGNRKEVEELPSSAGPALPLLDTRMCNYGPRDGPACVCVCVCPFIERLKHSRPKKKKKRNGRVNFFFQVLLND